MKPENWNDLPMEDKINLSGQLLNSYRGKYLLAQALYEATRAMSKVPRRQREVSNIQDMEMLLEGSFSVFHEVFKLGREINDARPKKKAAHT